MGYRRTLSLCLLLAALASTAGPALARRGDAYIDDVVLSRGPRGNVVLDFRVRNAMGERVLDTLDSGLPVRFTYWIQVVEPREFLPDDVLVDIRLVRTLEKDNLKDRYRVTVEGEGGHRDLGRLEAAVASMTRVEGVTLMPAGVLKSPGNRRLRIKAQLQKFRLPFRLHYVFAFVSYLDVETDWYVVPLTPDVLTEP